MSATHPTDVDPVTWLHEVEPPRRSEEGLVLLSLLGRLTGRPPVMWGPSIVGFGTQKYTLASGRQEETLAIGFSPRKRALCLYGFLHSPASEEILPRLGPYRRGTGCLYLPSLHAVDLDVLEELARVNLRALPGAS